MLKAAVHRMNFRFWKPLQFCDSPIALPRRSKFYSTNVSLAFECLTNRSILRVSGVEAAEFLQGLVTNDMRHLVENSNTQKNATAKAMYCMFLDARGRVMLDSIVYRTCSMSKTGDAEAIYLLECDSEIESLLMKHLKMYKLRRKVDIANVSDEMSVWVEFIPGSYLSKLSDSEINSQSAEVPNAIVCKDPRLSNLGFRHLCPKSQLPFCNEKDGKVLESGHYLLHRYRLGIGEGVKDMPPGVSFPLESNGDYLHGVSFHKGCYIGQELTARTHHTGVVRKRLMPLTFDQDSKISQQPDISVNDGATGKAVGKLRGLTVSEGISVGLGLLRVVEALKAQTLKVSDIEVKTHRPFWWPEVAPRDVRSSTKP